MNIMNVKPSKASQKQSLYTNVREKQQGEGERREYKKAKKSSIVRERNNEVLKENENLTSYTH
jgi:hypothetical protein